MHEQNHPLYSIDREIVNRLLARDTPTDSDYIDLARLFIRYEGFPGANDLKADMKKVLRLWEITRGELNSKTISIWANGFRPGNNVDEAVGSGFDTTESDNN